MALKVLMLRKKLSDKTKELETLRTKDAEFAKREAEIEKAIEEAETDEEKETVEEEMNAYEEDKKAHDEAVDSLEETVRGLEEELKAEEEKQEEKPDDGHEEREEKATMPAREFFGLKGQERDEFFAREDVKDFLKRAREAKDNKRALTNAGLLIPEVMIPMIRQITYDASKLLPLVYSVNVSGKGRQNVMGTIPEAVWTEACATLNELSLGFNDVEVDGYKLGGYFAVCNATLEDSDISLAQALINAIGESMAKAIDKTIVFGTGTKMPLGIVTRLAQTAEPASYSATARTWVDLHSTHIVKMAVATGLTLFKNLVLKTSLIANDYYDGEIVWIMNKKTKTKLISESVGANINAAIVAGMGDTMPVIGGRIIELPAMADDDIVFGHMSAYLWANRTGVELSQSEHYKFVEDQTVFRGVMRADGQPVIAEAFAMVNINNTAPTTTATFPSDSANP